MNTWTLKELPMSASAVSLSRVDVGLAPVFDRRAIAGLGDGEDFKSQLGEASETAPCVYSDFMTAAQKHDWLCRGDSGGQRSLVWRIGSIK